LDSFRGVPHPRWRRSDRRNPALKRDYMAAKPGFSALSGRVDSSQKGAMPMFGGAPTRRPPHARMAAHQAIHEDYP
jgi:hypothetical protein